MKDRELHKIVETIKLIKNTKNVGNNKINIDTIHGVDSANVVNTLNENKIKSIIVPVTKEYERRAMRSNIPYIDLFKFLPVLKLEGNNNDYTEHILKHINTDTIDEYDCFVFDQITSMTHTTREFISRYFRLFYPNKVLLFIYDSGAFIGYSDRIHNSMELRANFSLPKHTDRNPDYSAPNTFLANRFRNSKYQRLEPVDNDNAYEIKAVNHKDFMRRLSIEEIMVSKNKFNSASNSIPQFVCSNDMLGEVTKILRTQMSYKSSMPNEGEMLIAYNDFQTLNPDMNNIIIRKGSVMKLVKKLKPNMFIIEYEGKEHYILVELRVFTNILECDIMGNERLSVDEHIAHVFFNYAIASDMFEHVSFDNVFAYVNGRVSSSYIYSLIKMSRKTLTMFVDSNYINQELL